MPRQEFVLSYLLTPQNYEKEVIGVRLPLSFSSVDVLGYVMTYSPVMAFDGYAMRDTLLAERDFVQGGEQAMQLLASKTNAYSLHITYGKQADKTQRWAAALEEIHMADRNRRAELGEIARSLMADKSIYHEAEEARLSDAEVLNKYQLEAAMLWKMTGFNKREQEFQLILQDLYAEDVTTRQGFKHRVQMMKSHLIRKSDAAVQRLFYASDRLATDAATISSSLYANTARLRDSRLIKETLQADKRNQEAKLMTRLVWALRDNYGAQIVKHRKWAVNTGRSVRHMTRVVQAVRRVKEAMRMRGTRYAVKRSRDARLDETVIYSELTQRDAARITTMLTAGLGGKSAGITRDIRYASKSPRKSLLDHPVIEATYGGKSSVIYKAIALMEKNGVAARFINGLQLDSKYGRDSIIIETTKMSDSKGPVQSILERIRMRADKGEVETRALERWILASQTEKANNIIERLKEFDKVSHDIIVEIMEQAEVPDPEGIIKDMELKLGTNVDTPTRPAGMLETKLGWWDIGFDELYEDWHGKDYLDPPGKDFDYSALAPQLYDTNGVPFQPLGPTNLADVDVKMPVTHPIPLYAEVGSQEAWVDLYTFQDMCLLMAITLKTETAKLAGMTGQQALQYVLGKLYDAAEEAFPWNPEYKRMFRFIRWYSETLAHKESITVLHRVYEDWRDNIAVNGGQFLTPHTADQVMFQSNGVIEATSSIGSLVFQVQNFIDGEFSMSAAVSSVNPLTSSMVQLYVDDEFKLQFGVGAGRQTVAIPAGNHTYRIEYIREMGDTVKASGLVLTGVNFIEAHTTQRDNGEVRGLKVTRELINNLLHYYRTHHKNQVKGAEGIKQRKIWLT